jgi:hypothetical protein
VIQPRGRSPLQRVVTRVEVDPRTGCWLWTGSLDTSGYGQIILWPSRKLALVHRVTYESMRGPIPAGLEIDHLCSVLRCCCPDHLAAVTHRENIRRDRQRRAAIL